MARDVTPGRELAFYGGYALMGLGVLLFLSAMVPSCGPSGGSSRSSSGGISSGGISSDPFGGDSFRSDPFGRMDSFRQNAEREQEEFRNRAESSMGRAVLGFVLVAAGAGLNRVGRLGVAGAGLSPSPSATRGDLEPWARAGGGLIGSALDEAGLRPRTAPPTVAPPPNEVVKVRCPHCRALNDESDRFCGACGKPLL